MHGAPNASAFYGVGEAFQGKQISDGVFGTNFSAGDLARKIVSLKHDSAKIVASAALGGTVSKLTGGKFANGATTAASARLFNDIKHDRSKLSREDVIGVLQKEQSFLNSINDEEFEAYFKLAGLSGDPTLAKLKLQIEIHKELMSLKLDGTAEALATTPRETAVGLYEAVANKASGEVGSSGRLAGIFSNFAAANTTWLV